MVIVMEHSATEEQVQKVIEALVGVGYDVHRSTGVSHTVLITETGHEILTVLYPN